MIQVRRAEIARKPPPFPPGSLSCRRLTIAAATHRNPMRRRKPRDTLGLPHCPHVQAQRPPEAAPVVLWPCLWALLGFLPPLQLAPGPLASAASVLTAAKTLHSRRQDGTPLPSGCHLYPDEQGLGVFCLGETESRDRSCLPPPPPPCSRPARLEIDCTRSLTWIVRDLLKR